MFCSPRCTAFWMIFNENVIFPWNSSVGSDLCFSFFISDFVLSSVLSPEYHNIRLNVFKLCLLFCVFVCLAYVDPISCSKVNNWHCSSVLFSAVEMSSHKMDAPCRPLRKWPMRHCVHPLCQPQQSAISSPSRLLILTILSKK